MSHSATHWAWELEISGSQKFLLIALADMADESQSCFPSQKLLAKMTGSSPSSVARRLQLMEEAGMLTRVRRSDKDGFRTSDRFTLNIGWEPNQQNAYKADLDDLTVNSDGALITIESPVNKNTRAREPKIPFPADLELTQAMRDYAKTKAPMVNVEDQFDLYRLYWTERDVKRNTWQTASWQTWIIHAKGYAKAPAAPAPKVDPNLYDPDGWARIGKVNAEIHARQEALMAEMDAREAKAAEVLL
jgi:hypothetical protein